MRSNGERSGRDLPTECEEVFGIMNQQNISKTPDLPVKRKRGRPRKDESTPRNVKQHIQPPLAMLPPPPTTIMSAIQPPPTTLITTFQTPQPPPNIIPSTTNVNKVDPSMVGQAVTCVIDGIFDNGYLISTRVGPNNSILRGIVFQHGHVAHITPSNDVAPHLSMCTRGQYPIPPLNQRNPMQMCAPDQSVSAMQPPKPVTMQNNPAMVTGGSSSFSLQESLRLVEQDDVMQNFETSKTVEEAEDCDRRDKNEQLVSDPTAESVPERDTMICASVNEERAKEPDVEKPEVITPVETVFENQPSMSNDGLLQESQVHTGEASTADATQDPNQGVAVDLSLNNFPYHLL